LVEAPVYREAAPLVPDPVAVAVDMLTAPLAVFVLLPDETLKSPPVLWDESPAWRAMEPPFVGPAPAAT
jgi:hypothetical protein